MLARGRGLGAALKELGTELPTSQVSNLEAQLKAGTPLEEVLKGFAKPGKNALLLSNPEVADERRRSSAKTRRKTFTTRDGGS